MRLAPLPVVPLPVILYCNLHLRGYCGGRMVPAVLNLVLG